MTNQSQAPEIIAQKLQTMAGSPNLPPSDVETIKLADATIRMLQRTSAQNYKKIVELTAELAKTREQQEKPDLTYPLLQTIEKNVNKILKENEILAENQLKTFDSLNYITEKLHKLESALAKISTDSDVWSTIEKSVVEEKLKQVHPPLKVENVPRETSVKQCPKKPKKKGP